MFKNQHLPDTSFGPATGIFDTLLWKLSTVKFPLEQWNFDSDLVITSLASLWKTFRIKVCFLSTFAQESWAITMNNIGKSCSVNQVVCTHLLMIGFAALEVSFSLPGKFLSLSLHHHYLLACFSWIMGNTHWLFFCCVFIGFPFTFCDVTFDQAHQEKKKELPWPLLPPPTHCC